MKLNLGSGPKRVKGYLNVDALEWDGLVDIVWDLTEIPYSFVKEPIEEIVAVEVLEHISFRDMFNVLKEWHRILEKGGKLHIQVPDIGKMCKYYANDQICECVPHKAASYDKFKAQEGCWECGGKGMINPDRWYFAFVGAQKHIPHDIHKNVFNKVSLKKHLVEIGFKNIEFKEHIYKLIVNCEK